MEFAVVLCRIHLICRESPDVGKKKLFAVNTAQYAHHTTTTHSEKGPSKNPTRLFTSALDQTQLASTKLQFGGTGIAKIQTHDRGQIYCLSTTVQ